MKNRILGNNWNEEDALIVMGQYGILVQRAREIVYLLKKYHRYSFDTTYIKYEPFDRSIVACGYDLDGELQEQQFPIGWLFMSDEDIESEIIEEEKAKAERKAEVARRLEELQAAKHAEEEYQEYLRLKEKYEGGK